MPRLKQTVLAATAAVAIACLPISSAIAAGPLLFAPWALGHILAPLIVASAAASAQASYPAGQGYYGGGPGYYPPPNYYAQPPAYYAPPPAYYAPPSAYYPGTYYAPRVAYPPAPRFYGQPRGYYPSRVPYHASYGGQAFHRSGSYGYRRW